MSDRLRLVFDTESDGLIPAVTKVHCIVVGNLETGEINAYGPAKIGVGLRHLARADELIGHNITGFDLPVLQRLHGWAPAASCAITDTLITSRLVLPGIDELDERCAAMSKCTIRNLYGRHSLEAWGARLGMPKTGVDIEVWSEWTPEIEARCVADVELTMAVWRFLQPDGQSRQAMELEHRTAEICRQITAAGVPFDVIAAERLRERWEARCIELEKRLYKQYPQVTNFGSRKQIGELLQELGCELETRTEKTGQAVIKSLRAHFRRCGWLPGLDNRRIPGGADYKVLNRVVTAAEAIVCERWLIDVYDELHVRFRYGLDDGADVALVLWVHDELVACCRPEIAQEVGEIMVRHAKAAGGPYDFNVPLDAEFKIGRDWAGNTAEGLGAESLEDEAEDADDSGEDEHQAHFSKDADGGDGEEAELEHSGKEPTATEEASPEAPEEGPPPPNGGDEPPDGNGHDHAAQVRMRMLLGGYSPIPVIGKRPALAEWQKRNGASVEEIELWSRQYPLARNTGILTAYTPALDVDILAPEAAAAVAHLVSERFGDRGKVLVRTGKPPKCLIPFNAAAPFRKIKAKLTAPDGSSGQALEFLGDGQQFVADGIHPDTREPYRWSGGAVDEVLPQSVRVA